MSNKKPLVLFFSRDYQSVLFPKLISEAYDSIHVTLNKSEKKNVERAGGKVVACLEELYVGLAEAPITFPYLEYSLGSDRFIKGYSHEGRLTILKKSVTFWATIFDTYKPDFVINEVVALELSEVMYTEAKKRQIRYLAFGAFPLDKSFYWHENPFHSSMPERIHAMVPNEKHREIAREYVKKIKVGQVKNPYIKDLKKSKDIRNFLIRAFLLLTQLVRKLTVPNKAIRQLCYAESVSYYRNEIYYYFSYLLRGHSYDLLPADNVKNEIVFYPLHFEPEATLFYMSTYYDNQLALIENILKCMKEDQILVVKEHPAQPGFLMQRRFKALKNRFPNVKFLKADLPSITVINRCNVVITLVSTAGFEALAIGKPVILLGKIYYDAYPGVNYCQTFEEVYDLFRGKKAYNSSTHFEDYLAKLVAMQNYGNPWPPDPDLYSAGNINSIRQAIESQTNSLYEK